MSGFLRKLRRNRAGTASVEMALALPFLMAFMFTTFEGGYYLWTEHKVIKGVRQGARYAARLPFSNYNCGSAGTLTSLSNQAGTNVYAQIGNTIRTGSPSGTAMSKVKGWTNGDITISFNCDNTVTDGLYSSDGAPKVLISTSVEYPAIYGLLGFDTSNWKVRAQAEAAVMGT